MSYRTMNDDPSVSVGCEGTPTCRSLSRCCPFAYSYVGTGTEISGLSVAGVEWTGVRNILKLYVAECCIRTIVTPSHQERHIVCKFCHRMVLSPDHIEARREGFPTFVFTQALTVHNQTRLRGRRLLISDIHKVLHSSQSRCRSIASRCCAQ